MKFIDFFSGVGGFTRGLELAGHKCIGHCEFDKFAEASYRSMHNITNNQRKYLLSLPLKHRQKEILKEEYLNGEFYKNDIRKITVTELPKADVWCFGAPCQDFSLAGKRAGLGGERSSLVREVFRLIEELKEEDRPKWIIYENVKGMFSSNRGLDFLSIIAEMDRLGYDVEWQIINSKWFVPQNRERVYTIGHLREEGGCQILPIERANGKNSIKQLINGKQSTRVYDPSGIACTLSALGGGQGAKTGLYAFGLDKTWDNPKERTIANCILAREDNELTNQRTETIKENEREFSNIGNYLTDTGKTHQRSKIFGTDDVMQTLNATDYKEPLRVAIPVLTPDRAEKRQNGRRFKEDGETMFTLTAADRHGVAIDLKALSSKTRGQAFRYGYAACLDHNCHQGILVEITEACKVWGIWSEKYNCYLAIRKLTPKESFRLQGWTDDYYEKAEQFNSNTQLYKQAGNGVTVNVVKAIGERLAGEK